MKTGPDTLISPENESGRAKHEIETRRPPYRKKCVRERKNMKTEPDTLGTAKN
jgi:hypothetical protein